MNEPALSRVTGHATADAAAASGKTCARQPARRRTASSPRDRTHSSRRPGPSAARAPTPQPTARRAGAARSETVLSFSFSFSLSRISWISRTKAMRRLPRRSAARRLAVDADESGDAAASARIGSVSEPRAAARRAARRAGAPTRQRLDVRAARQVPAQAQLHANTGRTRFGEVLSLRVLRVLSLVLRV